MTNMNSADFLNAIDHAAGMNDRWLFLAAFCLLLLVCGVVIYWLVQQLQAVIADHKSLRDEHHAALTQIKQIHFPSYFNSSRTLKTMLN